MNLGVWRMLWNYLGFMELTGLDATILVKGIRL